MNLDHALLLDFALSAEPKPVAITTNPLACELAATLLAVDTNAGSVTLGFSPDARYVQGEGVVQGGIVAAMLDFALAFAVLARLTPPHSAATATLDVQFLRPALAGRFVATGIVRRLGGALAFAAAELRREGDDALLATATAALPLLRPASERGMRAPPPPPRTHTSSKPGDTR